MTHGSRTLARTGLAAAIALGGCADHVPPTLHAREAPPARLDERSFLKVHMTSGELYLLDSWQVDATRSRVDGTGTLYSPAREPGPVGRQSVRVEDVALFEALETHAVRRVRLLAATRPRGGRVLRAPDGALHEAFELRPALACRAAEGDCLAALAAWDGDERSSPADPVDLATREEIELEFPAGPGPLGLVIGARQTLLSTFLFYETIAHFGRGAGAFLAAVERGNGAERSALAMARVLGAVEASVAAADGSYRPIGAFDEAGPIAGDVLVLPFTAEGPGPVRVRLRLTKGHWRLDYLALARLGRVALPVVVEPEAVLRDGRRDEGARRTWRSADAHVVTRPGDALRLRFELPRPAGELELFLESEGFYYEWLRSEWLREEDPELALLSIARPEEALRRLAGPFKQREAGLDAAFWSSRFRRRP